MRTSSGPRWHWRYLLCLGIFLLAGSPARGARVTDLATSFDEQGMINADLRVGYTRSLRRGALKREFTGRDPSAVEMIKELRHSQVRHLLNLRADFSLWKALQVYLEVPLVLHDSRWFDFAQNDGGPCVVRENVNGVPTDVEKCVTPNNTTLGQRDGLLDYRSMAANQVEVGGPDGAPGGLTLPVRSGLDQLYIGIAGAPLSQRRDPTKPTWVIGFEARIGVGASMEYHPAAPLANTAVGRGVHQYQWWTAISHRFKYIDPWMKIYYLLPDAKSGSLFEKTSFALSGQERSGPLQRGGAEIGMEIIPYDRPEKKQRIAIELAVRMEGVFEGRDYSDFWELFANNPGLRGPCRPDPTSIDPRRWNNGTYCGGSTDEIPFPGITNIENHAIVHGTLAFAAEISRFFRARVGVALGHEQQHFITFGDAGRSSDGNGVAGPCEGISPGSICTADELQVNPMYRPLIDSVGRRFRVTDTTVFDIFLQAQGQF